MHFGTAGQLHHCEFDHTSIVFCCLLKSGKDSSKLFKPAYETFDNIPLFVLLLVEVNWPTCWNLAITRSGTQLVKESTHTETAFCLSKDGLNYWTADKGLASDGGIEVSRLRVVRMADGKVLLDWENLESEMKRRLSRVEQIVCGEHSTVTISFDRFLRVYDSHSLQRTMEIDLGTGKTPKRLALASDEAKA